MPIRTLIIRRGEKLTIRAMAYPADDRHRDKCPTLAFFEQEAKEHPDEFCELRELLDFTARYGPPRNEIKFKHLSGTDGLFEFKTGGGLRLLCFQDGGSFIICTHGTVKKRQKADPEEIKRAARMKADYELAKRKGELLHVEPKVSR
jgi:hypothetical protein